MSLYTRTVAIIEQEAHTRAAERERAQREAQKRDIDKLVTLVSLTTDESDEFVLGPSRKNLTIDPNGNPQITIDEEFSFTKFPTGEYICVCILPPLCQKGCFIAISSRQGFLNFVETHLTYSGHTETQEDFAAVAFPLLPDDGEIAQSFIPVLPPGIPNRASSALMPVMKGRQHEVTTDRYDYSPTPKDNDPNKKGYR